MPGVSICVPAYEEPAFLVRALASVFDQTYSNFEVIVTDDSRSTAVETAVKRWAADPRLRYVRNHERLGTPENWNKAIGLAERALIKMLHHDDWFASKQSLQQYVSLLESQPGVVFAFSGACVRDPQGEVLYQHAPTTGQIAALRRDPRCLFFGNFVGGPSATLFRRGTGFRFDPALKWLVDVEAYIRILQSRATFAYTSEPWVNTMTAGPRQVTTQVQADPGLQYLENTYVYMALKFSGLQRLQCWQHFMRIARGLNAGSVVALKLDAKVRDCPFEVRTPLTLQGLSLAARRYLARFRVAAQRHRDRKATQSALSHMTSTNLVRGFIKRARLYEVLLSLREKRRRRIELKQWERGGRPVPPPHIVKQKVLLAYASRYHLKILVETGTYLGDMVEAMKRSFDRIYSIELSEELHQKAKERFRFDGHVELIRGDSGKELQALVEKIESPALFWLDGHFSAGVTARGDKDTPIFDELNHILGSPEKRHVIVIDDARCFGTDPAYPTIEELIAFVRERNNAVDVEVKDDTIRISPRLR